MVSSSVGREAASSIVRSEDRIVRIRTLTPISYVVGYIEKGTGEEGGREEDWRGIFLRKIDGEELISKVAWICLFLRIDDVMKVYLFRASDGDSGPFLSIIW